VSMELLVVDYMEGAAIHVQLQYNIIAQPLHFFEFFYRIS